MQNAMSFYTDSSKNPKGAVEAGIFSLEMPGNISHRLSAETFIFSAELWAIFQVILITIDLGQCCVIFSDSRSALDSVQDMGKAHRNYTIYFIKQTYYETISKGREIILFWIPAHSSIPGNEATDSVAKQATLDTHRRFVCLTKIS